MTTTVQLPEKYLKIINHLANGLTKKEIADQMKCGYKAVERNVGNMLEMFEAKNTTHLIHLLWKQMPQIFK